ncbi:MAG: NUDIX domain-containing protein [Nanoarchaeota archaeon]|nr:NUDIX domain-containing protein [Nanoarchaeota archaeon]
MSEEMIPIVNENDEIIDLKSFSDVHKLGFIHRESYVYLINFKHEVLLQKRDYTGLWNHSAAGHFSINESYIDGAKREFEEELGISINVNELKKIAYERLSSVKAHKNNVRFAEIFIIKKNIPINKFKIDPNEVKEVKYFNKQELIDLLSKNDLVANTATKIIKKYILKII